MDIKLAPTLSETDHNTSIDLMKMPATELKMTKSNDAVRISKSLQSFGILDNPSLAKKFEDAYDNNE